MADAEEVPKGEDADALAVKRKADKERKKAEKEEKQRQKEENQKRRAEAQKAKDGGAAEAASVEAPRLTLRDYTSHEFGDIFIQSHAATGRTWTKVVALTADLAGQQLWIRARVATSRKQGKMLCFLQLRESMHTVQAVVFSKDSDIVPFAAQLPRESVVDVYGEVTVPAEPIASCSQTGVELQVRTRLQPAKQPGLATTRARARARGPFHSETIRRRHTLQPCADAAWHCPNAASHRALLSKAPRHSKCS